MLVILPRTRGAKVADVFKPVVVIDLGEGAQWQTAKCRKIASSLATEGSKSEEQKNRAATECQQDTTKIKIWYEEIKNGWASAIGVAGRM